MCYLIWYCWRRWQAANDMRSSKNIAHVCVCFDACGIVHMQLLPTHGNMDKHRVCSSVHNREARAQRLI
jgi:hypothetical protein